MLLKSFLVFNCNLGFIFTIDVEAGASATDDRRPVFQRMIGEASVTPSPFEAIVVHSLSRFFRDSLEFGLYEETSSGVMCGWCLSRSRPVMTPPGR